jgi:hypothetical protein
VDADEFRERVLQILREKFPDEEFVTGILPQVIRWKDVEFGLRNLHADLERTGASDELLRETIITHFGRVISMSEFSTNMLPKSWEAAKSRVRLQLMPSDFCRDGFSVTYPFLDSVLISVVIDSENGYAYVRQEDLQNWQISLFDLYEVARENLKAASQGIEISVIEGPPGLIALQTQDGYDAARILLPELRKFASEQLGSPFYAAVPNRDFLIMWPSETNEEFHESMRSQVTSDFTSRSHPLTRTILLVSEDSIDISRA